MTALSASGPTVEPIARARAREGGFAALALLVERGPTEALAGLVDASPPMGRAVAGYDSRDAAEADHEQAFGREAFPCAGALLHPEGLVGDASGVAELYARVGFRWDPSIGADHLATQLRAMAFLLGAEGEALEDRQHDGWARVRMAQRTLLDESLMRWVPVWVLGVQRTGLAWPTALAKQVLSLVLLVRRELDEGPLKPWDLEEPPSLDDPDTDLRSIATMLARPALGGVLITRSDLRAAARAAQAPAGFGPKAQVLLNALRSASSFGTLPTFIDGLRGVADAQSEGLLELSRTGVPGLADAIRPWLRRARATSAELTRLAEAAR